MNLSYRQRNFTSEWSLKSATKSDNHSSKVVVVALPHDPQKWKKQAPFLETKNIQDLQQHFAFKGNFGESAFLPVKNPWGDAYLFIGLGEEKDYYPQKFLQLGARISQSLEKTLHHRSVLFLSDTFFTKHKSPLDFAERPLLSRTLQEEEVIEKIITGFIMAAYKMPHYKNIAKSKDSLANPFELLLSSQKLKSAQLQKVCRDTLLKSEALYFVRDLANLPPNILYPEVFSKELAKHFEKKKVKTRILDEKQLQKEGFGGTWNVGKGSSKAPRFAIFEYNAHQKSLPHLVLVGKGVTFDTGGTSIKPSAGMEVMKQDMTGAACVAATLSWIADTNTPLRVTALIPMVENMLGPDALVPSDIFAAWGGKTIEVNNTDAEGRLILADALAYAAALKPDLVIDVATLTGAASITLGPAAFLLMGNQAKKLQEFKEATVLAGEQCWEMPLFDSYAEDLRSPVADIRNISGHREGSSMVAASFLNFFVAKQYPWLHLDICSYAVSSKWKGSHCPHDSSTGLPTLALIQYVQTMAQRTRKKK